MKKITFLALLTILFSWHGYAQFGCGSGVVISAGYTASNITTPGTGGPEAWVTGSTPSNNYLNDDVYLFEYTTGATAEQITMTIFTRNAWNGITIYDTCTGTTLSGELDRATTSSGNVSNTVTAAVAANSTVYIAVGQWGTPNDLDFDVTSFTVQSCVAPTALAVNNITTTSADLTWTAVGSETAWNIELVTAGTTPTGTPTATGVSNPYTATNLNSGTDYEFYVQAVCGSDTSTWEGPFAFTTPCVTASVPYLEDFNGTSFAPNCWSEADSGDPTTGPSGLGSSSWQSDEYRNDSAASTAAQINLFSDTKEEWLISPLIDLGATGGYSLTYDVAETDYANSGLNEDGGMATTDDEVQVLITTDNGATWTNLKTYDANNTAPNAGIKEYIDLAAYTGVVQFAFWASEGTINDTADYDFHIDNVEVILTPNCFAPTALSVANITYNSVEVSWTAGGSETAWNIEIVPAGTTPTGTPTATGVTNPYTATNLMATTSYDVYVQADCGSGSLSTWVGPQNFTTKCAPLMAPYTESFASTSIPACWSQSAIAGDGWYFDSSFTWNTSQCSATPTDHSGAGGSYASIDFSLTDTGVVLEMPVIDVSGLTVPALKFYTFLCTTGYSPANELYVEAFDGTNWNQIGLINTGSAAWEEQIIGLSSAVVGNLVTLRFRAESGGSSSDYFGDLALDDVSVEEAPACLSPSTLNASNITTNTADLSWVAGGNETAWNVEIVTTGTTPTGTPTATAVSNPYTATNLTSNTTYDYYVQANCGTDGNSSWVGPFTFTTACDAFTLPVVENFDAAPSGSSSNPTNADCWSFIASGSGYGYVSTVSDNSAPHSFRIFNSSDTTGDYILVSPEITGLGTGNNRVVFGMDSSLGQDLIVGTMSDASDATTFTPIQTVTDPDGNYNVYTVYIPAGTDSYLAFKHGQNDSSDSYYLYDITIEVNPSCIAPVDIVLNYVTDSVADLSWSQPAGTASGYNVEIVTAGTAPTGVPTGSSVSTNYTATNLMDDTAYDIYVQADCGTDGTSVWIGPFSFTTNCTAVTAPWLDDVEAFTPTTSFSGDLCWQTTSTSSWDWNIDGLNSTPSLNTGPAGAFSGSNYFYTEATNGSQGDVTELITPLVDIGNNIASLEFYYFMYGADMGDLYIDVFDGTAWVNGVDSIIGQQQTAETDPWALKTVDLSAYSGTIKVRFRAIRGVDFESDIAIDDIAINVTAPPCADPSALMVSNLSDTTADVSWTAGGTETEWEIEYGAAGFTQGSGTIVNDNDGTLGETLTGLTASTAYDVYVRAICGGGNESAWVGPVNFTTLAPPCLDPSALMVSNLSDTTADVSWTAGGTETEWEIEYGAAGFTQGSGTIVNDNDGTLGETLTGLTASTAYDVYVRAICGVGNESAWVGPVNFTTLAPPCLDPSNISVANITNTTADVTWTENGSATTWEIEYGTSGFTPGTGTIVLDNDGTLGETITGLTKDTNYDIYVTALCAGNTSSQVGPVSFKTDNLGVYDNVFQTFEYYPNPTQSVLNLKAANSIQNATIFNLIGQRVIEVNPNQLSTEINLGDLPTGAYLMQVKINESLKTFRIIKE